MPQATRHSLATGNANSPSDTKPRMKWELAVRNGRRVPMPRWER